MILDDLLPPTMPKPRRRRLTPRAQKAKGLIAGKMKKNPRVIALVNIMSEIDIAKLAAKAKLNRETGDFELTISFPQFCTPEAIGRGTFVRGGKDAHVHRRSHKKR